MGGVESKLEGTNWETADGGVTETIDGAAPTRQHTVVTLTKHSLVTQRGFDIHNDKNELLYVTEPVNTTQKWFDLLEPTTHKPLLRVQPIDVSRRKFNVYSYEPAWPNQAPEDRVIITKAPLMIGEQQPSYYRQIRVEAKLDMSSGSVWPFRESDKDLRGRLGSAPILQVEPVKGYSEQYQVSLPDNNNELVGYWSWDMDDKAAHNIVLRLAKGTDVALFCILAMIADLIKVDQIDLTVPLFDLDTQSREEKQKERTIVIALWKDRGPVEKFLDPSDEKTATEVEKVAENAVCVTMGPDGELIISESKHRDPWQSIAAMLAKMMISVGIFRLHGIVAMGTAVEEIEAATRDRPKRDISEENLSFLIDHMEEGYSALVASYPDSLAPAAVAQFKSLGAEMVWYAPESRIKEVVHQADI